MTPFQIFSNQTCQVGESPIWDAVGECLWWVDIESKIICRKSFKDEQATVWTLPERVGCIALATQQRVLAALETCVVLLTLKENGQYDLERLADIQHPISGMRFNDGRCDPSGRMWIGTMVMDSARGQAHGGIYCLDERGLTGPHINGLYTANGLAFSPDGHTMYFSDSHVLSQKIWHCKIDLDTGDLSERELFVDMTLMPGRPDGAAIDVEGHYWICGNDAGMVHCFHPSGRLLSSLAVPFPKPAMCAFGGADLQTLFVTSIVPSHLTFDAMGHSGKVVFIELKSRGLPEPIFSRFPDSLRFLQSYVL